MGYWAHVRRKFFELHVAAKSSLAEVALAHIAALYAIERAIHDDGLGLGRYEGRGWRGFHHHASMSIATYGFLMAQRLRAGSDAGGKKNFIERQVPAVPKDYVPRGSPARAASRGRLDHDVAPPAGRRPGKRLGALSAVQLNQSSSEFVTQ